jgi:hypothetical protein
MFDPVDYMCYLIVDTLTRFARLVELVLKYLLWQLWSCARLAARRVWYWITIAGLRSQQIGSHVYWKHIHRWLVISGFQRELTWAEIEDRRLQAIARTGVDIPRPLALEAGLRQEKGLQDV